jgi:curli biogenesis system outer membrane secretion channel CsgG
MSDNARQGRLTIVMLLMTGLLTGCGATAKFIYPSNASDLVRLSDKPEFDKTVAVLPFDEERNDSNQAGTYFLYLVPFMPYGWATYERPDAARYFVTLSQFEFNVSEDLAKAAVTSIRKSGLFKDVFFSYGGDKDKADLILKGEVISTKYEGSIYSYGLSLYGPLLWIFGLPAGSSTDNLGLKFSLVDLKTSKILWESSYTGEETISQGYYYNWGHDVRGYSILMEKAMNEALKDMHKSLAGKFETPTAATPSQGSRP